jgi:hypothetical protein
VEIDAPREIEATLDRCVDFGEYSNPSHR